MQRVARAGAFMIAAVASLALRIATATCLKTGRRLRRGPIEISNLEPAQLAPSLRRRTSAIRPSRGAPPARTARHAGPGHWRCRGEPSASWTTGAAPVVRCSWVMNPPHPGDGQAGTPGELGQAAAIPASQYLPGQRPTEPIPAFLSRPADLPQAWRRRDADDGGTSERRIGKGTL